MTRKDYVKLAGALSYSRPPHDAAPEVYGQWKWDVHQIVKVLSSDNSRFDEEHFREACNE